MPSNSAAVCAFFHDIYAKSDARLALLGKSRLKRSPLGRLGAQADRANRLTHRPQKSDGAFRDDDVRGGLLSFSQSNP